MKLVQYISYNKTKVLLGLRIDVYVTSETRTIQLFSKTGRNINDQLTQS